MSIAKQFKYIDTRHEKNPHVFFSTQIHDTLTFQGVLKDTIGVILQLWDNYRGFGGQMIYTNSGVSIDIHGDMDKHGNIAFYDYFYTGIGKWKGYITKDIDGELIFSGIWKNSQEKNNYEKFTFQRSSELFNSFIHEINDEPLGVFEYISQYYDWSDRGSRNIYHVLMINPQPDEIVSISFFVRGNYNDSYDYDVYINSSFEKENRLSFDFESYVYDVGWQHYDIYFKDKKAYISIDGEEPYVLGKISNQVQPFLK